MKPGEHKHVAFVALAGLLILAMLLFAGCNGINLASEDLDTNKATLKKPPTPNPNQDSTPPAAVTDLTVTGVTYCSADLAWTATGDDGVEGQASSYDIKYSDSMIKEENWDSAEEVYGEPAPLPAGEAEAFTVFGLEPGTKYYFALKVTDDAGNSSGLSNVPEGTTSIPQAGDWVSEFVDYANPYLDLAFDQSGNPSIAYTYMPDSTKKYAHWNGNTWDKDVVQTGEWGWVQLEYCPLSGDPTMTFGSGATTVLARKSDGSWEFEELNANPHMHSLAYNPVTGFPAIAYPLTEGRNKRATTTIRLHSWNGFAWVDDIVNTVDSTPYIQSLAFDSTGKPYIAYETENSLVCSKKTSGEWVTDTVELYPEGGFHVVSIAVDNEDNPGIAYERLTGNRPRDLMYAHWNGATWDVESIEHGDGYFPSPSLAYSTSGVPMIGYIDRPASSTHHQVKLATASDSSWSIEVVAEGYIGPFVSLALDQLENPAICYNLYGLHKMYFAKKL